MDMNVGIFKNNPSKKETLETKNICEKSDFFGLEDNALRSGAGPPPTTRLLNIIFLFIG
jgi:hypothetical protein